MSFRRQSVALLGLCFGSRAFLSSEGLPRSELCRLHGNFGGDSKVSENLPMPQRAKSGGTISALSVQMPALERLKPYLSEARVFDLGFGSGVMAAMFLAVGAKQVLGVDLEDKVEVATSNMLRPQGPFTPFAKERCLSA